MTASDIVSAVTPPRCDCSWVNRARCEPFRNDHTPCWSVCCHQNAQTPVSTKQSALKDASKLEQQVSTFLRRYCATPSVATALWMVHRGCLSKPAQQIARCAQQLNRSGAWPSPLAWNRTRFLFSAHSTLFLGDSTLRNKWAVLHEDGIRSACVNGSGVCYRYRASSK